MNNNCAASVLERSGREAKYDLAEIAEFTEKKYFNSASQKHEE